MIQAAQRVLEALGSSIPKPVFIPLLAGWEEFNRTGKALPDETVRYVIQPELCPDPVDDVYCHVDS